MAEIKDPYHKEHCDMHGTGSATCEIVKEGVKCHFCGQHTVERKGIIQQIMEQTDNYRPLNSMDYFRSKTMLKNDVRVMHPVHPDDAFDVEVFRKNLEHHLRHDEEEEPPSDLFKRMSGTEDMDIGADFSEIPSVNWELSDKAVLGKQEDKLLSPAMEKKVQAELKKSNEALKEHLYLNSFDRKEKVYSPFYDENTPILGKAFANIDSIKNYYKYSNINTHDPIEVVVDDKDLVIYQDNLGTWVAEDLNGGSTYDLENFLEDITKNAPGKVVNIVATP